MEACSSSQRGSTEEERAPVVGYPSHREAVMKVHEGMHVGLLCPNEITRKALSCLTEMK